jgi:hypothetical protein
MNKPEEIIKASEDVDWNQLMGHNGSPCFHVDEGRFCLRADYWPGHDSMHKFISLHTMLSGIIQR